MRYELEHTDLEVRPVTQGGPKINPESPGDYLEEYIEDRVLVRSGTRELVQRARYDGIFIRHGLCLSCRTQGYAESLYDMLKPFISEDEVKGAILAQAGRLKGFLGFDAAGSISLNKTLNVHVPESDRLARARFLLGSGHEMDEAAWLVSFKDSALVRSYLEHHGVRFVGRKALKPPDLDELVGVVRTQERGCRVNLMPAERLEEFRAQVVVLCDWVVTCIEGGLLPTAALALSEPLAGLRLMSQDRPSGSPRQRVTVLEWDIDYRLNVEISCERTRTQRLVGLGGWAESTFSPLPAPSGDYRLVFSEYGDHWMLWS